MQKHAGAAKKTIGPGCGRFEASPPSRLVSLSVYFLCTMCFMFYTKPGGSLPLGTNKLSKQGIYKYTHREEICCCWQLTTHLGKLLLIFIDLFDGDR